MEHNPDLVQDIEQAGGSREQGLHLGVRCHISAPELLQFPRALPRATLSLNLHSDVQLRNAAGEKQVHTPTSAWWERTA